MQERNAECFNTVVKAYLQDVGLVTYCPQSSLVININDMTSPSLVFALLIALFYGALFHLIRGGGFWRLLLYFSLSVCGFILGHLIGVWREWMFLPLGSLNLGLSTLGSLVLLAIGDWLSRIEAR
ncbi:MAG TPA: hypothetical protein VFG81_09120 [Anaerolineales bacterium]|nr:hypothetical protein [Anaerolineales bacterium]